MYDKVRVFPPGRNPNGAVLLPDGTYLNTSASTTSGLQEALNWAQSHGYDVHVYGGLDPLDVGPITYFCATPLYVPAWQGGKVTIDSITLGWSYSSIGSQPGLVFDSVEMFRWDQRGQIAYDGTGPAVLFQPRNPLPGDKSIQMNDSELSLGTVGGNGQFVIKADLKQPNSVGMLNMKIRAVEGLGGVSKVSGNVNQYGVYVTNPNAGGRFSNNEIDIRHLHGNGLSICSLQVGESTDWGGGLIQNNVVRVDMSGDVANLPRGFDYYGSGGEFHFNCDNFLQDGIIESSCAGLYCVARNTRMYSTVQKLSTTARYY